MSKIFSALKKAQGELASIASPLIEMAEGSGSQTAEPDTSPEVLPMRLEEAPNITASRIALGNVDRRAVVERDPKPELVPASGLQHVRVENVRIEESARIVLLTDPRSPGADRFRYLRLRMCELRGIAKLKTVVLTSPQPRDGKSTVAMNLATALSEGGKRNVLLIEADLYNPTVAKTLGVQPAPGLAECLQGGLDPVAALQRLEPLGWYLLQAGTPKTNPSELLQLESLPAVMQKLSQNFEWILIDTPPVAPLSDALVLARHADAALLVARAGRTQREGLQQAVTLLGSKRVVGIVLNAAESMNKLYSEYSEYYGKK